MGGSSHPHRNEKPPIKYSFNPLDGAFIEPAKVECENLDLTSSENNEQNSKISEPKVPDMLSTRELVSTICLIWDCQIRPLSAFLSKTSSRNNAGRIQNGEKHAASIRGRIWSPGGSADDEHISHYFPTTGDSSFIIPLSLERLTVTQKISIFEHTGQGYSAFWRLVQGISDKPQESSDGKSLGSRGIKYDLKNVYGWMNNVNFVSPKHCVISTITGNHRLGYHYDSNPPDCCISTDLSCSVGDVTLGSSDDHADIGNNNKDLTFIQKVNCESIMQASNTILQVEDDFKSLKSINANTSALDLRVHKASGLSPPADHNCASEEEECRTDLFCHNNENSQPMKATEHATEAGDCVSSEGKANYITAKPEHAFAGAMAGIFVSLCLHPLDTVKTVVQSCHANQNSLHHIGRSIVSERGFTGLYRGISSNIASSAPISAIYTFTYESVRGIMLPLLPKEYQSLAHCMAGGCASIATSFVFTPSERIKQQMQVGSDYRNCWYTF